MVNGGSQDTSGTCHHQHRRKTKMRKKDNQCTICGRNIYPFQRTSTGCVYCDIFGTNIKGEKIKQPIIKNKNNKKLWRKKI
jgi:hypothetical protein